MCYFKKSPYDAARAGDRGHRPVKRKIQNKRSINPCAPFNLASGIKKPF